jgi:hypothetical protein
MSVNKFDGTLIIFKDGHVERKDWPMDDIKKLDDGTFKFSAM